MRSDVHMALMALYAKLNESDDLDERVVGSLAMNLAIFDKMGRLDELLNPIVEISTIVTEKIMKEMGN